jgi:hypothetical protein
LHIENKLSPSVLNTWGRCLHRKQGASSRINT